MPRRNKSQNQGGAVAPKKQPVGGVAKTTQRFQKAPQSGLEKVAQVVEQKAPVKSVGRSPSKRDQKKKVVEELYVCLSVDCTASPKSDGNPWFRESLEKASYLGGRRLHLLSRGLLIF
jgi:hypothetical protein